MKQEQVGFRKTNYIDSKSTKNALNLNKLCILCDHILKPYEISLEDNSFSHTVGAHYKTIQGWEDKSDDTLFALLLYDTKIIMQNITNPLTMQIRTKNITAFGLKKNTDHSIHGLIISHLV